jgi:ankyrin repeat protein
VLEVAASAEKWDVFAFLAEAGANTAAPTGYDELPLLFDAVEKGNLKYVDALLQARADVNVRDSRGRTPLWLAVEQPIVLERLIRAGAALDVKSAGGDTILHHAARVASPEIVSRLAMAAPQLLGERNSTGRTPLLVASAEGRENIEAALRPLQPAPAAGTGARPPAPNRPPSSTPASEFVITRAGVASRGPDTRIRIDENTAQIEARLGTLFAVEWNIPRVPGLAQLHMSVDIDHPPFPGVSGPESTHFHTEFARPSNAAGYPDLYAWSMDKPAELQPGTWRFVVQVYRDEARTDQLYMAEHTFEVATVP